MIVFLINDENQLIVKTCHCWFVSSNESYQSSFNKKFDQIVGEYGLRKKFLIYVKDEGSNMNVMIIVLKYFVSCECLGLWESFQGSYFDHAFSKACQYVTIDDKVCQNL